MGAARTATGAVPRWLAGRRGPATALFLGRGGNEEPGRRPPLGEGAQTALGDWWRVVDAGGDPPAVRFNRQVHSNLVVDASAGPLEADGLRTDVPGRALCIFTADCLPVLFFDAGSRRVTAVHAGWRGLAAGILGRGLEDVPPEAAAGVTAWIGPAIGSCCYEVSDEVAIDVAREVGGGVIVRRAGSRPRLDLVAVARRQLRRLGVLDVRESHLCTRCADGWWSYRGDGPGQGRNHAFVWLGGAAGD